MACSRHGSFALVSFVWIVNCALVFQPSSKTSPVHSYFAFCTFVLYIHFVPRSISYFYVFLLWSAYNKYIKWQRTPRYNFLPNISKTTHSHKSPCIQVGVDFLRKLSANFLHPCWNNGSRGVSKIMEFELSLSTQWNKTRNEYISEAQIPVFLQIVWNIT